LYEADIMRLTVLLTVVSLLATVGCASNKPSSQAALETAAATGGGEAVHTVEAVCYPPQGWTAEPLKKSGRHSHQVWLSPTGETAYGVIHFSLPLPVGPDFVLRAFIREMQKQEGAADLLGKHSDPHLPGLRFEARGQLYHLWGNLVVRGFEGWAVYAGSRSGRPICETELQLAATAREATRVGAN
jgi:hypothetical protein